MFYFVAGSKEVNRAKNNTKKEEPKSPDVQKNGAMREPELSQSNDNVEKTSTNNLNCITELVIKH